MAAPAELASLIAAVAAGDRTAFENLYRLTAPKLLGVAVRIIRDRQIAEDVLQDAYFKVWQSAHAYSAEAGRPMTWLIAIVRHRAIDLVRARRDNLASLDGPGGEAALALADPSDPLAGIGDRGRLVACLGRLESAQRDCFTLAYVDGYSREELASRFAKPVNTIKTWLHRSAAALRACLVER